ncbi:hypothetical protein LTR94_038391, partial [Friedmanniomyces endolithicus]
KVDAIFFGGYAPQGAPMARQMKQLGLNVPLLGGDTLCSPEMARLGGEAVGDFLQRIVHGKSPAASGFTDSRSQ